MGLLLKEALRRLCAEAEWSYSVFWRPIECQNSRHLIWEEGYFKSSRVSCFLSIPTFEPSNKPAEGCEVKQTSNNCCVSERRCQAEDRICLLVEKMMKPLVHIVGYGIVGCAAFTGNHQWILQSDRNGEIQPEVLAELKDQFLAGVQTVAIIPVLPHGVIQLGSIQRIIENTHFVNYVKTLLMQLGGVPGPMSCRTMLSSTHPGLNGSGGHAEERCAKIDRSTAFIAKSANIQNFNAPVPRPIKQPFYSPLETYQSTSDDTEVLLISKSMNEPLVTSCNRFKRPRAHLMLQSGDAQQFSNSGASVKQSVSFDSICGNPDQPSILNSELTFSELEPVGWHLSSFRAKKSSSSKFTSQYDESFLSDSQGPPFFTSCNDDSASLAFFGKRESPSNSTDHGKIRSLTCSMNTENLYDVYNVNSSHAATLRILNDTDFLDSCSILPRDVTSISDVSKANSADSVPEKQKHELDVPQAISKPCHSSSECFTLSDIKFFHPISNIDHSRGSQNYQTDDSDPQGMPTRKKTHNGNFSVFNVNENISIVNSRRFTENDLFDALGADFIPRFSTGNLDEYLDGHAWESSTDASPIFDPTQSEFVCNDFFSDTEQDQLLDAIVSKISSAATQSSDDNLSCKTTLSKTRNSTADINSLKTRHLARPGKMQRDSLGLSSACDAETAVSVSVRSSCSMENIGDCSIADGQNKSQISLWVESTQCIKNDSSSSSHCKRSDETGKSNKKRPKSGESPRPRPKDRQMIQDRVKELREIVPNGAKCSIDALLERTIKHMLFLQCVTKHADKLKEAGEPKILSEGGLLMKDNFEGGATWAFEIGSQSMICPIIVEDLNPPRQLLVEMLCEDRGFFLEIADLIKGLGFTILKGVMESRKSKIWARFAVEANRDVTRMDIFLSLVRLLEPSALTNVAPQDISSMNLAQNILATGMADKLIQ